MANANFPFSHNGLQHQLSVEEESTRRVVPLDLVTSAARHEGFSGRVTIAAQCPSLELSG